MRLTNDKLHSLLRTGRFYKVAKGQIVQSSDERFRPLFNLIHSGYIKRYEINNDGTIAIHTIYGPGDVFPLSLIYEVLLDQKVYNGPEVIYYEAMCESEIYSTDIDKLAEAAHSDYELYKDLLAESGLRSHISLLSMENHSLKSSLKRIAHLLATYGRDFGEPLKSGIKIKIGLTHQDIADILNLTRETVSTNMHKLQTKKLIVNGRSMILLRSIEKLENLAYN